MNAFFHTLKKLVSSNPWFFIPWLVWVFVGGLLVSLFPAQTLFFSINQVHRPWLDYGMTFFTFLGQAEYISIVLLSLFFLPAFRTRAYLVLAVSAGISVTLLSQGLKKYFSAPRPLEVFGPQHIHTVAWLNNNFQLSFPSGHTLGAFAFFTLYSFFLSKQYKPFSALFFMLACLCGLSRVYLGQHFVHDVYAGSIIGTVLMVCLYALMETFLFKKIHPFI